MMDKVFNLEGSVDKNRWARLIKRLGCKIDARIERASPACEGEFINYFAMCTDDALRQLEQEWDRDRQPAIAKAGSKT